MILSIVDQEFGYLSRMDVTYPAISSFSFSLNNYNQSFQSTKQLKLSFHISFLNIAFLSKLNYIFQKKKNTW